MTAAPPPPPPAVAPHSALPGYVLGVDGGGSKTTALVADAAGRVAGRARAGPSNLNTVGEANALAVVQAALTAACADAGCPPSALVAAGLGLAGFDRPADHARLLAAVAPLLPGVPVTVVNDVALVLAAGTPAGWGIGVIAGTGAIAFGGAPDRRSVRVGGWGWAIGDEGSGFALGRAALQAVMRAADGRGPQTALTGLILRQWALAEPTALLAVVYQTPFPRPQIAALAALVEAAAEAGDAVAVEIIRAAGRELALAAHTVAQTLGFTGPTPGALAGGVLVNGRHVRRAFTAALVEFGLRLEPVQLVAEPAQGALVLARRLAAGRAP